MSKKSLLIITLDGACWEGFLPWLEQDKMPTVHKLSKSGSWGKLRTVLPTFVYPNWASFWTGENPGRHMLFSFAALGKTDITTGQLDRRNLKRPMWLEIASDCGLRVVSLYAQLTYPPPALNGYVVSELHMRQAEDFTHPPELVAELRNRFKPLMIPKAGQFFPKDGFNCQDDIRDFTHKQIQSISQTKDIAEYLFKKSPWDVGVVHFFATDPFLHALWNGVDSKHPEFNTMAHQEVGKFFSALDRAIGDLVKAVQPKAVMLFSSHGFTSTRKILNLSRLFWKTGIFKKLPLATRIVQKSQRLKGGDSLSRLLIRTSPKMRELYHRRPWYFENIYLDHKAIYVRNTGKESKAVTNSIIHVLESVKDPESGTRVIRKAWRAEELYGRIEHSGWDVLVLEFAEGYTARNGNLSRPILWSQMSNRDYLTGTHTQIGMWLFSGSGISARPNLQASILDLPPTILSYLGIPVPKWMEGSVL